jgi:hypothetical protein
VRRDQFDKTGDESASVRDKNQQRANSAPLQGHSFFDNDQREEHLFINTKGGGGECFLCIIHKLGAGVLKQQNKNTD